MHTRAQGEAPCQSSAHHDHLLVCVSHAPGVCPERKASQILLSLAILLPGTIVAVALRFNDL